MDQKTESWESKYYAELFKRKRSEERVNEYKLSLVIVIVVFIVVSIGSFTGAW